MKTGNNLWVHLETSVQSGTAEECNKAGEEAEKKEIEKIRKEDKKGVDEFNSTIEERKNKKNNLDQGKVFTLSYDDIRGLDDVKAAAVEEAREKGRNLQSASRQATMNYQVKLMRKYCSGSTNARIEMAAKKITCL